MKKLPVLFLLAAIWLFTASTSFAFPQGEETGLQRQATGTTTPTPRITPTLPRRPLLPDEVDGLWSTPADITEDVTMNWRAYPIGVCDPYQNLHIFWADNYTSKNEEEGITAALFYRNDIQGSFSTPKDVLVTGDQSIHFPQVTISTVDNTFHFTWVNTPNGTLYYTSVPIALAEDARAWQPMTAIDYQVFNGSIVADAQGVVHLFYGRRADEDGLENEVVHTHLKSGERDWSSPEIIYSPTSTRPSQIRTEAAVDGSGRLHVGVTLRSVEYGKSSEVGYLRSPDGGKTWDPYKKIEDTGKSFQGVEWIAPYTFGKDEVHLTWHDPERMHIWSEDGGETWTEPAVTIRLGGAFGGSNDLVKDSAGTLRLIVAVQGGVYASAWSPETGTWQPPELIDGREVDNHGQRIIVCQGNQLHTLFYDRTGETTAWYSTRKIDAPSIARQPIPTLPPIIAPTKQYATQSLRILNHTATPYVVDPDTINKAPAAPVSPMMPILIPAGVAVIAFILIAGVVQLMRMRA